MTKTLGGGGEGEFRQVAEDMRALARSVMRKRENDHQTVACELEQIVQSIAVTKLLLDRAMALLPERSGLLLDQVQVIVSELFDRVRESPYHLYPRMLETMGLLHTLHWYLDGYTKRTRVQVDFRHTGLRRQLSPNVTVAAFRIIEEALTNIVQHANVNEASVLVQAKGKVLHIRITDKGAGFDISALVPSHATGLIEMRERALMLGGEVAIQSTPGAGTTITAMLPLGLNDTVVMHECAK